ncbi:MAG: metal-dependent transcriptional regulator [Chloroflexota bacterium]
MIIESTAKYLIAIYHLTRDAETVSTKAIAEHLGVQQTQRDPENSIPGKGALSPLCVPAGRSADGTRRALGIRRLYVLETFMGRMLNYPLAQARFEASQIEPSVTNQFVDQIEALLERLEVKPGDLSWYDESQSTTQEVI